MLAEHRAQREMQLDQRFSCEVVKYFQIPFPL